MSQAERFLPSQCRRRQVTSHRRRPVTMRVRSKKWGRNPTWPTCESRAIHTPTANAVKMAEQRPRGKFDRQLRHGEGRGPGESEAISRNAK